MIPQTLTNTNLFIDGVSFAGDVPSLTLPKLAVKTEQYRAGGMDAPVSIDMGLEAMEAKFSTNGARREALNFFGLADQSAFNGVFRGSFKGQKGASVPVVATLRGLLKATATGRPASSSTPLRSATTSWKSMAARSTRSIRSTVSARSTVSTSWPACATTSACKRSPDMTQENRLPGWLTLDADAALVRLASGTVQRVSVDTLTLRAPTVRDIRLAGKVAGDDAEERELQLFASLAQVSRQDLEGLKLSDYQRLQGAYFRLVQDDTDDTFAYASTGEAPGH